MLLSELIVPFRRVAVVGLAKNTGKTETLGAILRELEQMERAVGVTSVGRDGEARDAIDARIEKPRMRLAAGSLVATTDALLRASALEYQLVEETGIRTPLGRVVLVRLKQGGPIEVAGPSAAQDVRAVADAMLEQGADQVLVDGAINRRAASSPAVCDGLVMCTGAVLHRELERVVSITQQAVELVRLPAVEDGRHGAPATLALPARFGLTGTAEEIAGLLGASPDARRFVLEGALHEPFLRALLRPARARSLEVVVEDSTKVFLGEHGCAWYARRGVLLRVVAPIELCAITVNPVAPHSHSFDSRRLRERLKAEIPHVAVRDVRDLSWRTGGVPFSG